MSYHNFSDRKPYDGFGGGGYSDPHQPMQIDESGGFPSHNEHASRWHGDGAQNNYWDQHAGAHNPSHPWGGQGGSKWGPPVSNPNIPAHHGQGQEQWNNGPSSSSGRTGNGHFDASSSSNRSDGPRGRKSRFHAPPPQALPVPHSNQVHDGPPGGVYHDRPYSDGGFYGGPGSYAEQVPPPQSNTLSPQEIDEFRYILGHLQGSKDSIKEAKNWIVIRVDRCKEVSRIFYEEMVQIPYNEFGRKLHFMYLINDVLHDCMRNRSKVDQPDNLSLAFLRHLGEMLCHAYYGHEREGQEKIEKVLRLWGSRYIFDNGTIDELEAKMKKEPEKDSPTAQQIFFSSNKIPSSTLHLTAGVIADLIKGLSPYTPLDKRRVPPKQPQETMKLETYVRSRFEDLMIDLEKMDPSRRRAAKKNHIRPGTKWMR